MSKKDKATKALIAAIAEAFPMMASDACEALAVGLADAVEIMVGKPKRAAGEGTPGSQVWQAYAEAFEKKYEGAVLARGAEVNTQCARLATALGVEQATRLVEFYLTQTESFYVQARHPLSLLVRDLHKLKTNMDLKATITRKGAERIETAGATLNASVEHLRRKYGNGQE
jgi:predicted RecB family endonuclease